MGTAAEGGMYLSFRLDDELFALGIDKVREVLEFTHITKVPRTPDYMRGVINLRGTVMPVVDLKLKLGLGRTEKTVNTCVIIAELNIDGERTVIGALADSVQEVLELDTEQIAPPPRMGMRFDIDCIRGMGRHEDGFLILLDIDHVLSGADLRAAQGLATASEALPAVQQQPAPAAPPA